MFVTAAHCAEGARVRVSFNSAYQDGHTTYTGTFHSDPQYSQTQSDPHDLAVVVLDKPGKGITPARLAAAGSLDKLSGTRQFTSVGYGAYEVTNSPGGHSYLYDDVRGVATGMLNSVNCLAADLDEPVDRQTAAPATATRAARTSRAPATFWRRRRSPAKRCAARPTSTTGSTPLRAGVPRPVRDAAVGHQYASQPMRRSRKRWVSSSVECR